MPLNITAFPKQLADANSQSAVLNPAVDAAGNPAKLGFYGVPAVSQPSPLGNTNTPQAGSGTAVFTNTTFDGGVGGSAYTIGDIVLALKNYGLFRTSPAVIVGLSLSPGVIAFDSANGWTTGENPPQIAITLPSDGSVQVGDWYCMFYGTSSTLSGATQAPWHQITSNDVLNGTVGLSYNWGVTRLPAGLTYFGSEFGRGATAGTITVTSVMSNIINDTLVVPTASLTVGNGVTGSGIDKSQDLNATSLQIAIATAMGASSFDRATFATSNTKVQVETTVRFFAAGYENDFGFDAGTLDFHSPGYQLPASYPGNSGASPGFTVSAIKGNSFVTIYANGTTTQPATNTAITDNDVFPMTIDLSGANPVVSIYQNANASPFATVTLTSLVPPAWKYIIGGTRGNGTAGAGVSDSPSVNFGTTSFTYPKTGFSPYV